MAGNQAPMVNTQDFASFQAKAVPRVTFVMAVYNAARYLHEAMGSVLKQTYTDFELIVVDDSSSDDSLSIAQSFGDPRIRIIQHDTNLGAALSRNDALAAARGEFIAIMDADDVCMSTRLERQVNFLDANPQVGVVGCAVYDNIDSSGAVLHTSCLPEGNEAIQRILMERWCFLHSSLLFRKWLYEIVGGYRRIFEPAEDHDFVLRIVERCEARNLAENLISYRVNSNGLSVIGHKYVKQSRYAAIKLAERRRKNQPEDLEVETAQLLQLKRSPNDVFGLAGVLQKCRDSLYAANRYYGLAVCELSTGDVKMARRCFVRSLRTNCFLIGSWIGIVLSFLPFTVGRSKMVLQSSTPLGRLLAWLCNRRPLVPTR